MGILEILGIKLPRIPSPQPIQTEKQDNTTLAIGIGLVALVVLLLISIGRK